MHRIDVWHDPPACATRRHRGRQVLSRVPSDRAHEFLANGGTLENAQAMAHHDSPRTTQIYDRIAMKSRSNWR